MPPRLWVTLLSLLRSRLSLILISLRSFRLPSSFDVDTPSPYYELRYAGVGRISWYLFLGKRYLPAAIEYIISSYFSMMLSASPDTPHIFLGFLKIWRNHAMSFIAMPSPYKNLSPACLMSDVLTTALPIMPSHSIRPIFYCRFRDMAYL